jgi:tight adherence protein C
MMLILPLLAFVFASALVALAGLRLAPQPGAAIDRRLAEVTGVSGPTEAAPTSGRARDFFKRIGARAPRPTGEVGKVRTRLIQAGYRGEEALAVFYGIRISAAIAAFLFFATPILFKPNLMFGLGGSLLGYVLPGILLAKKAARRQHRIQLSLPDALDLLVVSVEAGLGLDQALLRVGQELVSAHPELSDELRLVNLELRAGKARSEALRNLADRTGLEDIGSLVTMLVQTDKFGTSVAQSLRVHSDVLRTKRRQRAEEAAAKTGVKMVFPLVFCIFPAIWVVAIGPAAIKFVQVLFPMAQNIHPH